MSLPPWKKAFSVKETHFGTRERDENGNFLTGSSFWEVLLGVGVDGVGGNFPIFFVLFRSFSFFLGFLRFSFLFLCERADNCNLPKKWGISLQPLLHRPHPKLSDLFQHKEKHGFLDPETLFSRNWGSGPWLWAFSACQSNMKSITRRLARPMP